MTQYQDLRMRLGETVSHRGYARRESRGLPMPHSGGVVILPNNLPTPDKQWEDLDLQRKERRTASGKSPRRVKSICRAIA